MFELVKGICRSIITSFLIGGSTFSTLIITCSSPMTFYGKHQSLELFLFSNFMDWGLIVCIFSVKTKKPAFLLFSMTSSYTMDIIQCPWKFELKACYCISKLRPRSAGLE